MQGFYKALETGGKPLPPSSLGYACLVKAFSFRKGGAPNLSTPQTLFRALMNRVFHIVHMPACAQPAVSHSLLCRRFKEGCAAHLGAHPLQRSQCPFKARSIPQRAGELILTGQDYLLRVFLTTCVRPHLEHLEYSSYVSWITCLQLMTTTTHLMTTVLYTTQVCVLQRAIADALAEALAVALPLLTLALAEAFALALPVPVAFAVADALALAVPPLTLAVALADALALAVPPLLLADALALALAVAVDPLILTVVANAGTETATSRTATRNIHTIFFMN
jgi:hypothetical protein